MTKGKGFLIIVSGPAGTGKGTICKEVLKRNPDIVFSVSATTRKPREGEVDGVNYHFISEDEFKEMIANNEFLEHAYVHTNYYGSPKKQVIDEIESGKIVLLEIDVQGAMQVKENYDEAIFIFLLPPSMGELRRRIVARNTETKEEIDKRMENAYKEVDQLDEYDYFVINEDLDEAISQVENIIKTERLRVKRNLSIKNIILSEEE